ncbi:amino acid transporter [Cystobacter fuscus DSM 2262]|uniref:Amino acid transporter n=1 Tax=Cystobacter fuscus (strain ATCC 25194 / DSM 2262 / NBRC 100088 / M29) TaxID=1242864 RepID=S9PCN9_CYSF2|nr:amino acid permease [Cystobacter fuscus]EPX62130.1 amino acid transporter [Cystobacter fuscus DSM 2262]
MDNDPKGASLDADAAQLQRLGYAQQLLREMGGFSNFAVSFSIISILTGAVTLYGHGLRFGGPFVMTVGWPLVAVMTLMVAASLAQLASSFPTAGALYHWSAMLGGPRVGFFTAWLNTIGQFAITAGIDYGLAEFVADMLGWPRERGYVLPLYAAILASHAVLNHVGVRAVALLNNLSAWYHVAGVALLIGALVAFAPRRDLGFLFTRFTAEDHVYSYGFLIGLLQAQWTFTGYDASAHVSEETKDPTRNAPWGIFLSVAVSAVVGYVLLVGVTLAIRDLPVAADAPNPFLYVLRDSLGPALGGALVWVAIGAMWFCGLSSVTSNSRMLFAFARDGGLPASPLLARVSPRFRSPHVAVWVSVVAAFVVAIWSGAYAAMVALSTLALYASYAVPIWVGWRARRNGTWSHRGPWDLGRFSSLINGVALAWCAAIMVLFVLPPNELAGYTFAGCLALLVLYWMAFQRHTFVGPKVTLIHPASSPAPVAPAQPGT